MSIALEVSSKSSVYEFLQLPQIKMVTQHTHVVIIIDWPGLFVTVIMVDILKRVLVCFVGWDQGVMQRYPKRVQPIRGV